MQLFHSQSGHVQAIQVADDLDAVMRIAEWIYTNGGRLTDPMTTFDCAFRFGPSSTPVNVGDWVVRDDGGGFTIWSPEAFAAEYKAEAS